VILQHLRVACPGGDSAGMLALAQFSFIDENDASPSVWALPELWPALHLAVPDRRLAPF